MRYLLLTLLLLGVTNENLNAGEPEKYRLPPWHLVSNEQRFFNGIEGNKLTLDFQCLDDIEKCDDMFLIPYCGQINGVLMYFGYGNVGIDNIDKKPKVPNVVCGVFSRWGTKDVKLSRPAKGGMSFGSDHEDNHISSRTGILTEPGRVLTLQLEVTEKGIDEARKPYIWIQATIHDLKNNTYYDIGHLRFPGKTIDIERGWSIIERSSSAAEIESIKNGTKTMNDAKIPRIRFIVGNWKMDGKPIHPIEVNADYQERIPQYGKRFMYSQVPEEYRAKMSDTFPPTTSVFLFSDNFEWKRPPGMFRFTTRLSPQNMVVAKIIRESEVFTCLQEQLYKKHP